MKIALLGGTGNLGKGLAVRLSLLGYEVIVGSRSEEKALRLAEEYSALLESVTPLIINIMARNKTGEMTIKFV